jgi:tripartite-type tricarboxylate transporter receptor subunit TctC
MHASSLGNDGEEETSMIRLFVLALGACATLAGAAAWADGAYPQQSIRLLIPAEAGGGADFIGRLISPRLSQILGQTVVVENKPGASGTIAGNTVARAKADGYTLVLAQSTSIVAAQHMYKELAYDPLNDLAPVTLVALVPNILVVNPKSGIKNVNDLVARAKVKPNAVGYGSSGYGSPSHLAGKMFEKLAGVQMLHVPYKGAGPTTTALLGGQIDAMFAPITAVLPLIKNHQLLALGVTTPQRLAMLPEVPTIAESGLPGFDINSWFGLFAPANTPASMIARLNDAVAQTLKDPRVAEAIDTQAAEPVGNTTAAFVAFLQTENEKTMRLIENTGAKAN